MRVISFCADGLTAAAKHGFYDWALQQDADILCLQNLQCQERGLPENPYFPKGYHAYFLDTEDDSNGVAIYTRQLPKAIMTGLGMGAADAEARYIQADFADLSICSLLAPTASTAAKAGSQDVFLRQLSSNLDKVRKKRRQYILCGNLGVAHQAIDLLGEDAAEHAMACRPDARAWFNSLLELGYVDGFRAVSSDPDEFSWWPEGRERRPALRVDYQLLSASLCAKIEHGAYYKNQVFSSHAPLVMDYDLELRGL